MKLLLAFLCLMFFTVAEAQLPSSNYLHGYQGNMYPALAVTISSGQTTSNTISQGGLALVGCLFPTAFTGTTITFNASVDNVHFYPVYNSAGPVSYTVAPSRYLAIVPSDLQGIQYLQIVSGSTEAATRNLTCSLKGL